MFKNLWGKLRKNRLLTVVIVLVILAALFFAARPLLGRGQRNAESGNFQIATIERGNLVATIGATGSVRANQSAQINWESGGTVDSVLVVVGDSVAIDAQLASLSKNSLPQNVILAQSDLEQAQDALDDFYDSYGAEGIAQAEKALAEARDAFADAHRTYSHVSTAAKQVDIDQALSNLVLREDQLDKAKEEYEPFANKPESNLTRANLLGLLATAQKAFDNAARTYNNYTTPGTSTEIAIAQADLDLAALKLTEAQEKYDEVLAGPTAQDIGAAEARLVAARATLSQAGLSAPFAGIVTEAFPTIGDVVSPGQLAFRLDDLSRLLVDVEVSEVDINRVEVGQMATLTFDAALEKDYVGEVAAVALAGTTSQGAVNFRVTVELLEADEGVRPGMTAAVNIVVTELENVVLIPNRAVRVRDGARVVYLMENNQLMATEITLGATSESFSQILEEDLEGRQVVLNPPSFTFDPNGGPPPFVRGGGGGFR